MKCVALNILGKNVLVQYQKSAGQRWISEKYPHILTVVTGKNLRTLINWMKSEERYFLTYQPTTFLERLQEFANASMKSLKIQHYSNPSR